ncbi:MAG: hypothetical protein LBQ90_05750 [Synergistaceae bacterium]|jgi:hypothetical protein|nr:hypothetical protein [Synergistaceae bacterium]
MEGNFEFIKELELAANTYANLVKREKNQNWWAHRDKLYENLSEAEKHFWTNRDTAATSTRKALENYVSMFQIEHEIRVYSPESGRVLGERIRNLGGNSELFRGKEVNVDLEIETKKEKIKEKIKGNANLALEIAIRFMANAIAHDDREDMRFDSGTLAKVLKNLGKDNCRDIVKTIVPATHSNLLKILEAFHEEISQRYCSSVSGIEKFDETIIPINDYKKIAEKSYLQDGGIGLQVYEVQNADKHGILYLYPADNSRTPYEFRQRKARVERLTSVDTIAHNNDATSGLPPIKSIENLHEHGILVYIFNQKPLRLNKELFEKGELRLTKKEFCRIIASGLCRLQQAAPPIYHRILSDNAIVIDEVEGRLVPRIINFYLAKIDDQCTLRAFLKNRSGRYMPPDEINEDTDWGKWDVYSLGVLFMDILDEMRTVGSDTGNDKNVTITGELKKKYADEFGAEWWPFLERMCSKDDSNVVKNREKIKNRPTMEEVVRMLSDDKPVSVEDSEEALSNSSEARKANDETQMPDWDALEKLHGQLRDMELVRPIPRLIDKIPGLRKRFDRRFADWKKQYEEIYGRIQAITDKNRATGAAGVPQTQTPEILSGSASNMKSNKRKEKKKHGRQSRRQNH